MSSSVCEQTVAKTTPVQHMTVRTALALGAAVFFWASAFPSIRYVLNPDGSGQPAYAPGALALLRFGTASVVLAIYAAIVRMPLPAWRDVPWMFLLGLIGIAFYHVTLNYGSVTVPAGPTSLLINTSPVFTALFARFFLRDRLRPIGWLGIAISFAGAILIAMSKKGGLHIEPGALLILACAVATSAFFVMQKPYLPKYGSLALTAYPIWAGTLLMLIFAPTLARQMRSAPCGATAAVLYLGVFPAATAYLTWAYALSRLTASRAASFMYLAPPLTFAIAWIGLGERPAALALIGGVLAIGGVVVVNTWGRR